VITFNGNADATAAQALIRNNHLQDSATP